MMVFRSLCKTDCKKVNWAKQMFFLWSIYMFWLFLINVEISLLRQLYSRNTVLFNLTISGNDAFSAMCNVYLQSGLFIPLKPSIADKPIINLPFPVVETVKEHLLWCTAIGTPPIQVKLFKDNIPLASGISRVIFRPKKTATYTCFANNSFGTDSREFQVTLSGKYSTGPYWTNTEPLLIAITHKSTRVSRRILLKYKPLSWNYKLSTEIEWTANQWKTS